MDGIGIGFDVDHTLLIDNMLERIAFLRLLEDLSVDGGHTNGTLSEETDEIDRLLDEQRHGLRSIEETVRAFVSGHGIMNSEIGDRYVPRFKSAALALVDELVIPMPGARQTLAALLARGIPVACLTNGWNPLQQVKALRAGFDGTMLVSAELGVQKPDPRAFAVLGRVLGRPHEWYVGDTPQTDVAGALAAGFHAVWFDAEGRTYPAELPKPSATIHTLAELLETIPRAPSATR